MTRRAAPTGAGRWDYNSQEAAGLGRDVTRLSANPEGGGNGRPSVRGLRARGAAPCLGTAFFSLKMENQLIRYMPIFIYLFIFSSVISLEDHV